MIFSVLAPAVSLAHLLPAGGAVLDSNRTIYEPLRRRTGAGAPACGTRPFEIEQSTARLRLRDSKGLALWPCSLVRAYANPPEQEARLGRETHVGIGGREWGKEERRRVDIAHVSPVKSCDTMRTEEIEMLLADAGAVRHGHFVLSSGRHGQTYVQCALVLAHPEHAEALGRTLAERFRGIGIDAVVSMALGGLILGHEVARALGVRALFVERDANGKMALRRGFEIQPAERILVIEDVWTTGKSTREGIEVVESAGGRVVALGALVDRSGGSLGWKVPAFALLEIAMPNYVPEECPLCRAGSTAVRPGSRFKEATR